MSTSNNEMHSSPPWPYQTSHVRSQEQASYGNVWYGSTFTLTHWVNEFFYVALHYLTFTKFLQLSPGNWIYRSLDEDLRLVIRKVTSFWCRQKQEGTFKLNLAFIENKRSHTLTAWQVTGNIVHSIRRNLCVTALTLQCAAGNWTLRTLLSRK